MEYNHDIKELERYFNKMECPDCGGVHQCRLYKGNDNKTLVTFIESGLFKICWGYKSKVHKQINAIENK